MVSRPWSSILLPRANKAITLPKEEGLRSQHEDGLVSRELLGVKFNRAENPDMTITAATACPLVQKLEERLNLLQFLKSLKLTYKGKSQYKLEKHT